MKGFDYVALQGFYDALEAYGFPDAIAELDRAAQSHTKVLICTAYSMAGPITVNAVTKQGGRASHIELTLNTSLGHRYLEDIAKENNGVLLMQSRSRRECKAPHLPDHNHEI